MITSLYRNVKYACFPAYLNGVSIFKLSFLNLYLLRGENYVEEKEINTKRGIKADE